MRRKSYKKKEIQKNKEKLDIRLATVVEALPNTLFRVEYSEKDLNDDEDNLAIVGLNGKMKKFRIRVLIGDKVEVLQDEYGGRGRIVKRLRN